MANVKGVIIISGGSVEDSEKVIAAAEKAAKKIAKVKLTVYNQN